jgi:arylsulfatase A-like enzyme
LLVVLLLLPLAAVLWLLLRDRPAAPASVHWVVHENVMIAFQDGEIVRATEILDVGTLRGQFQTVEVDPQDFGAASGMVSNPLGAPPYAWLVGLVTGFELDVLQPQDRQLLLTLANGTNGPQHVTVNFNGRELTTSILPEPGPVAYVRADVPSAWQVRGTNRVDLAFTAVELRQLVGQPVPLPVAAILTHVAFAPPARIDQLPDPPPPAGLFSEERNGVQQSVLVVPPGTAARVPLLLPDARKVALRFHVDQVGVPVQLSLRADDDRERRLATFHSEASGREMIFDLGLWAGQPVILEFWAREGPGESARISGALILVGEGEGLAAPVRRETDPVPPAARPSFLIVTLDAFARRQLGTIGRASDVAPRLDALAGRGIVYGAATAPATYTLASVGSLLTGQAPLRHGVVLNEDVDGGPMRLPPEVDSLAQVLTEHGWRTAAWVTNPNAAARHGFDRGFPHYEELFRDADLWDEGVSGEHLPARLAAWLAQVGDDPFLAWVHLFEPHAPYRAPDDLIERFVQPYDGPARGERGYIDSVRRGAEEVDAAGWWHLRELYAARMALADRHLGALLDVLEQSGRAHDTVIVVTSDHGEALGEHGRVEHGDTVYGEELEIPLVLVVPGRPAARRMHPATLTDIAPTLLRLAGIVPPAGMDGVNLLDAEPDARRPLLVRGAHRLPVLAWTRGPLKLVVDMATRSRALYDLARDPGETRDLSALRPATAALMYRELCAEVCAAEQARNERERAQAGAAAGAQDELLREQLATIGYNADGTPPEAVPPEAAPAGVPGAGGDPARSLCGMLRSRLTRL